MVRIENYAKQHSLETIKDFIESYGDWGDKNVHLKRDIEYICKTVNDCNKRDLINCDIYISEHYPLSIEMANKYSLARVSIDVVESYSEEMLCQVLLCAGNYLKDCVDRGNLDRIVHSAVETVVKQAFKRGVENLLGVFNNN